MDGSTAVTITTLMTSVGEVFTTAVGWVGEVAEVIASQPILTLCCVGLPLSGIAIGFFKRLLHSRV